MIGLWFSFGPDSECLIESVKAFRLLYPDHKICICDCSKKPLSRETINVIAPDHYEMRIWNSMGNLNGWSCIRGILEFQMAMQQLFPDYKGAIKMDCDTLMLDGSWIDYDAPIAAFDLGTECLFAGFCRYLRKDVPNAIIDELNNRWQWDNYRVPEDQAIGNYCMKIYGRECRSLSFHGNCVGYSFVDEKLNLRPCKVISFGNRNQIKEGSSCDKRAIAAMHMATYARKNRHQNTIR